VRKGIVLLLALGLVTLWGCPKRPGAQTVDRPRHIYITDTGNNRLVRIDDVSGKGWTSLGSTASTEANHFDKPQGLYVDENEPSHIYVADTGNCRIVRMDDMTGANWEIFGRRGDGASQFNQPTGIFVDGSDHLHVADRNNDRIATTDDMTGTHWLELGKQGSGENQFSYPNAIFVDPSEHMYVADSNNIPAKVVNNRIVRMDDMYGLNWISYKGSFARPSGIFVDHANHIYVTDSLNDNLSRMDDMHGKNLVTLGGPGGTRLRFNQPGGVFVDDDGHIYVADTGNDRIVRMDDMTGRGWVTFGTPGKGVNQLDSPCGVFVR
ncbi:MAG: repeat containing protein, partial [Chthonomonadaceae bacterium]|nr:repeat containing protein [Chthonomonadaceae bacterium]